VKQSSDIEWIEVTGHTLKLKERGTPMAEIFKNNIVKSPLFTDKKEDITPSFKMGRGDNNLTAFTMTIKLKKPIKQ